MTARPRCERRAAAWRANVTRAAAYFQSLASSPEEVAAIDAELQTTLGEGPDFTRYHRNSDFREPPQVCTDRNYLARIMFVANTIERKTYAVRGKGKHGGALGRSALTLLRVLLYEVSKREGRLYPCLETLARLARMSKQTVVTALGTLQRLGFVTRYRRIKRIRTPLGVKVVQDSNAYSYDLPNGLGALGWAVCRGSESNNLAASTGLEERKMLSRESSGNFDSGRHYATE